MPLLRARSKSQTVSGNNPRTGAASEETTDVVVGSSSSSSSSDSSEPVEAYEEQEEDEEDSGDTEETDEEDEEDSERVNRLFCLKFKYGSPIYY